MANAGTVIVELSLNDAPYKQKLSEDLKTTEVTAKGMETAWKTLGIKSGEYFDAQRRAFENSFTIIKNATTSTTQDIIRAEEAKVEKLKALDEQQYGHQATRLEKLKGNYLAVAAVIGGAMATISTGWGTVQAYMESEQALLKMGMAMKNQGDFSRAALADLEAFAGQLQETTAYEDDFTFAVMANLKTYGMSNAEVKIATQTAIDFATAKRDEGMTVERASEILGKSYLGITTGLKKLGIQVDENAKGAAVFEQVQAQLQQRFGGSAQAELTTYAGQWKHLQNQWSDVQEFLGLVFLKTLQGIQVTAGLIATTFLTAGNAILGVLRIITTPLTAMLQGVAWLAEKAGMESFAAGLRSATGAIGDAQLAIQAAREGTLAWTSKQYDNLAATDKVTAAIENMGKTGQRTTAINEEDAKRREEAAKQQKQAIEQITEAIRKNGAEVDTIGKTQYEKDLARIEAEQKAWEKKTGDKVLAGQWAAQEITLAEQKMVEEVTKLAQQDFDNDQKLRKEMQTERQKEIEEEIKQLVEIGEADIKRTEDAKKLATERGNAEREILKDLRGFEQAKYDAQIILIDEQEKKYRALQVSEVAITEWKRQEVERVTIAMAKSSDSFYQGALGYILEMKNKTVEWGTVGYSAMNTFATESSKVFSSLFYDAIMGNLKSLGDYFDAIWKAVLRTFLDMCAQMLVQWAMVQAAMAVGLPTPSFAGAGGGAISGIAGGVGAAIRGTSAVAGGTAISGATTGAFTGTTTFSAAGAGGGAATGVLGTVGTAAAVVAAPYILSQVLPGLWSSIAGGGKTYDQGFQEASAATAQAWVDEAKAVKKSILDTWPDIMTMNPDSDSPAFDAIMSMKDDLTSATRTIEAGSRWGYYASGGRYSAGQPFWAGERGAELIIPDTSGRVLSHSDSMQAVSSEGGSAREIKSLRDDQREANYRLVRLIDTFTTIIQRWEGNGLPATRT